MVNRFGEHNKDEFSYERASYINGLEGFWGYLKRKLASKGGVRREYLCLFLGEYVWRYNYRKLSLEEQRKRILKLLKSSG